MMKFLITVMLIYRHWVIMAYSDRFLDIIVLKKCEVYSTKNVNIPFVLAKPKSKKGQNSVKSLQITTEFDLDHYFIMLYQLKI